VLEASPGRFLPESGAILWYLAGVSRLAPDHRIDRAETLRWMFFEQHSLEPYIGAAHFWLNLVKGGRELQVHAVEDWMENGYRALRVMEKHLTTHRFLAANRYTPHHDRLAPRHNGHCGVRYRPPFLGFAELS
jgi:glutathione S-transferase